MGKFILAIHKYGIALVSLTAYHCQALPPGSLNVEQYYCAEQPILNSCGT
jgi:hypothetical protein